MTQFDPAGFSANQPQAPQGTDDVADFTRIAQQLKVTPEAPDHIAESDTDRFAAVAAALKNLPPQMADAVHDDPAGASATIDSWIRTNIQGDPSAATPQGAQAIHNAYKSVYVQRPSTMPGGRYDQQQYMQWLASQRGEYGNFAAGVAQGGANVGLDVLGAVAPQTANDLGNRVNETYNTDPTRFSGQAGEFVGSNVASLPAMLVPGAAVPAFAAMGAGGARRDIAQRRTDGQEISGLQEAEYAGSSGAIQGVLAHYLGKIMNGKPGQVPLQGLIRSLSPELLKSIQGTDGAVIRPLIQRTLLNAGVGASQNEIAMIAQETAKSLEGITGGQDPDLVERILKQSPHTLAAGAVQGGAFSTIHEARNGSFGRTEVGEPVQGEEVQQQPQAPTPQPAAEKTHQTPLSDSSDFFDQEDTGNPLPIEKRDTEAEALTATLRQQAAESDEILKRVNAATERAPEPVRGVLPNTTDLTTGEIEHPAVTKLKKLDPSARIVDPGEHRELFDDVSRVTGTKVIPVESRMAAGFADPDHPDAVLVSAKNPKTGVWNAVAHEVAHTFQYEQPELYKQVRERLPQWFKKEAESTYKGLLAKLGHSPEAIDNYWKKSGDEEIVSMAFGESAVASKMLQRQFRGSDTGLWSGIRSAVEKVLNKFTSRGRIVNEISSALRDSIGIRENARQNRKGIPRVRDEAKEYAKSKGLAYSDVANLPLNEERSKRVAAAYGEAKHEPDNPKVEASYRVFKKETLDQFKFLQDRGVKFEPWTGEGQPYKDSAEMMKDVGNKHLYVFTGGDMPADHPLAEKSGVKFGDQDATYNDVFRAVHDYFGHAREGFTFGPRGEDNAYRAHSSMFSQAAKPAMAAETRGQNSFVNFGPNAEHNRTNPKDTIFAEQKATTLADENLLPGKKKSYVEIGHKFNKGNEEIWWQGEDGEINTSKKQLHVQEPGTAMAEFRGRIDHNAKEISVAGPDESEHPLAERQAVSLAKRLSKKYPGYEIYVAAKGGMTPVEELTSGHLYPTMEKVREIEDDKPLGEKSKDIYNAATPDNAWKFGKAVGDTLRRGLSDSLADFVDEARAIAKNLPVTKVPLEAYIRLHAGVTDRIGKMRVYGLRKLFGDAYSDPKTGEGMNRQWQLDPVKQAVERLGNKAARSVRRKEAFEFTNFATRVGVAESTIERGDNSVRNENFKTMQEKIRSIIRGLPGGEKLMKGLEDDSGGQPNVENNPDLADVVKSVKDQHKKTLAMVKDAEQRLADAREMNKAADAGPDATKGEGGKRSSLPSEQAIQKAEQKLKALHALIDAEASGDKVEPGDILSADDLTAARKRALEKPLTGIAGDGANGFKDVETARKFLDEAKQEKNHDLAQEFLRRYRLVGNAHLDILVQSGRLSRDLASKIRKSNEFYTDLHRVMEKTGTLDPSQTPGTGILHKFRGSNRDIDNPYINQQMTTERSYQVAERNFVLKEFISQAKEHGTVKPTLVEKEGGDTISVYENGEKKIYKVDPLVAEAINGWGKHVTPDGIRLIGKVLGLPGRTWMALTQKNPFYHINNVLKDMRSRAILSKESGGVNTLATEFAGLKDKETRELVEVLGGTFGGRGDFATTRAQYERITRKALADVAADPNALLSLPSKAWKGLSHFAELSEAVGRTAEYTAQFEAAKKRGMGEQEARTYAAWKARDLMDFAVSGTWIKAINEIAYVPVLNAQFRGLAKHLEAIKSNPQLYAKRMALFGLLPALIPAVFAHAQGEDQWKKYKGIPLVQRIMFDNYMLGDHRIVIPRGEMTASASMMHELAFQNHFDVNDVFRALMATQVPNAVENPEYLLPLRGVREARANYSWFYNRNIIPPDEEGVALDLRKTDNASPLAKAISMMAGKAGWELDPRKIEHVINTDAGTLGSVADTASRIGEDKGLPAAEKASMLGGYNRTTPGYTDQEVQRALATAERYKDTANPAVQTIKGALAAASKATSLPDRQKLVDEARQAAEAANGFYDTHADTLLTVKKLAMRMNAVKDEYSGLATGPERAAWVKANPDKLKLLRAEQDYSRINNRISELRRVMQNPQVSDSTRKVADREVTRLYSLLVKMSDNH